MNSNIYYLIAAVFGAIPGTIAAIASLKNGRKTDFIAGQLTTSSDNDKTIGEVTATISDQIQTANDLTIGEMVEDSHAKLSREDKDYDKHHPSIPSTKGNTNNP